MRKEGKAQRKSLLALGEIFVNHLFVGSGDAHGFLAVVRDLVVIVDFFP